MSRARGAALVVFLAVAAYANSLGNGFAYDDNEIVRRNPVVVEGDVAGALTSPYWPVFAPGSGLYRPVTVGSFALEWTLFGGAPAAFHALSVVSHAAVSALVLAILAGFLPLSGAVVGAALFAVHPVHTEAVANVVGRAELYAAIFFLSACLLYLRGRDWSVLGRGGRLVGILTLYFLALGSKEIAVTLPAVFLLLDAARRGDERTWLQRVADELPVYLGLGAALAAYLLARHAALGSLLGEIPAPELRQMAGSMRVVTALSLWPEYLRLLLIPLDLSADYAPGVLVPPDSFGAEALLGASLLLGLLVLAVGLRGRRPVVVLGVGWLVVTILPVSQLFFATGTLLAERTLYLPSVGLSFVVGGLAGAAATWVPRWRRTAVVAGSAVLLAFFVRTTIRNPSWLSTFTMLDTLAREHPESYLAQRTRAAGLIRAGEVDEGRQAYLEALTLAPSNYGLLVEVAAFHGKRKEWSEAETLLRRAIASSPERLPGYRHLASQLINQGRAREGHAVALEGLARAGRDRELWSLVSESYIAKADLAAAARARRAALGADPDHGGDWRRLSEILEAMGDPEGARLARERAGTLAMDPSPT